tara:strand:+ start:824 stop:1285 length:462 start_codon:yes stop_codon:yes gene_type:complete
MSKRHIVGVLLATPKAWPDARVKLVGAFMKRWISDRSTDAVTLVPNVIPASLEWSKHYQSGMPIEEWIDATLDRKSPALGTHRYHMVLVPGRTCGRITAVIVAKALAHPKLVVRALVKSEKTDAAEVRAVTGVTAHDPEDWTAGWTLQLGEPA